MTTNQFAEPGATSGQFKPSDHKGALLLIDVHSIEEQMPTTYGPSNAARVTVTILDGEGTEGETFDDTLLFGKVLVSQLRSRVGQKVLGRMVQGTAKAGQSPPWLLDNPTDADRTVAMRWVEKASATSSAAAPPF